MKRKMKSKGMKRGGAMKSKGYRRGGMMKSKGMKDCVVNMVRTLDFVAGGSKEAVSLMDYDHPLMGTLASRVMLLAS